MWKQLQLCKKKKLLFIYSLKTDIIIWCCGGESILLEKLILSVQTDGDNSDAQNYNVEVHWDKRKQWQKLTLL